MLTGNFLQATNKYQKAIHVSLLMLISLTFMIFDWNIGLFTFGDYIFGLVIGITVVSRSVYITKKDTLFLGLLTFYVSVNVLLNEMFNVYFYFPAGVAAVVKITFYSIFIILTYRYIKEFKLEKRLIKYLNMFAIFTLVVGFYIIIAIYSDNLPFKFIWTFTRQDKASYIFRETLRMRSTFSEPAHLGYYFNSILSLNLFSIFGKVIPSWINVLLIIGVLLTFSYSSIVISCIMLIILLVKKFHDKGADLINRKMIIYLIIFLLVLFFSRDFIYRTVILRTIQIINGEDGSAFNRIFESWIYIKTDYIWIGNGAGNTPPITNNFAYMLSDLGLIAFVGSIIFTVALIANNTGVGLIFVLLNFQKGGYLSPAFSLLILFVLVFVKPLRINRCKVLKKVNKSGEVEVE